MATVLLLIETGGHGGAESMLVNLAHGLRGRGHRVLVQLLRRGWLSERLEALRIETRIEPLRGVADLAWLRRLRRALAQRRVDIVHAHEFAMNTYGSLVAACSRVAMVTTVHGKNYYPERLRRRLAYRCVARMSHMVAVSDDVRRFLESEVGIPSARVRTIHNGVDTSRYLADASRRQEVRAKLGLRLDATVIGTVGNLYPVKGHVFLLRAFAVLCATYTDIELLVIGRGRLRESLIEESRKLGIASHVHFLGFRDDVADLLQAVDVVAMPSLSEGMPMAILEAMSAERPVVVTAVGGLPEVVEDGVTGYLVPKEAPETMAERISWLVQKPDLRRTMGRLAREVVKSRFSVETMISRYEALYGESIRKAGRCFE